MKARPAYRLRRALFRARFVWGSLGAREAESDYLEAAQETRVRGFLWWVFGAHARKIGVKLFRNLILWNGKLLFREIIVPC